MPGDNYRNKNNFNYKQAFSKINPRMSNKSSDSQPTSYQKTLIGSEGASSFLLNDPPSTVEVLNPTQLTKTNQLTPKSLVSQGFQYKSQDTYKLSCRLTEAIFVSSIIIENVKLKESVSVHHENTDGRKHMEDRLRGVKRSDKSTYENFNSSNYKRDSSDSTSTCFTRLPSKASEEGSADACQQVLRSHSCNDAGKETMTTFCERG